MEQKDLQADINYSLVKKRSEDLDSSSKLLNCKICDKVFSTSSNLKQHTNVHKNSLTRQKFTCFINNCCKSYLYICTLKKHVQSSHLSEYETILNDFNGNERNFNAIYNYLVENQSLYKFIKIKHLNIKIKEKTETTSPEKKKEVMTMKVNDEQQILLQKLNEAVLLNPLNNNYNSLANNYNGVFLFNELLKLSNVNKQLYNNPSNFTNNYNSNNNAVVFKNMLLNLCSSFKNSSTGNDTLN